MLSSGRGGTAIQLASFYVEDEVPDEEASQTKGFNYMWNTEVGCGLRGLSDPEAVPSFFVCGIVVFNFARL